MTVTDKRIVVTGAASGIGRDVALWLDAHGAEVIALDLREPEFQVAAFHAVDLGDPAAIDAVAAQLADVDAVCNIAGVTGSRGAELCLRVNFLGLRHLTGRLLDAFKPGASIVNMASFAGARWRDRVALHRELIATDDFDAGLAWLREHPVPEDDSYPYSKELLIVWTYLTARALIPEGIRMNAVSPGPVSTGLLDDFIATLGSERVQEDIDRVGRPGIAEEIAPVVGFLCSDDARWVNGHNLAADGGLAGTFAFEL